MAVGVKAAARSHHPPFTAAAKLINHVPTVTVSVTIAAVAGCSVTAAATAANAIVSAPFKRCPAITVINSGAYTVPPYDSHNATPIAGATVARIQPSIS